MIKAFFVLVAVIGAGTFACDRLKRDAVAGAAAPSAGAGPRAATGMQTAPLAGGILREAVAVRVGATSERWVLEWRRPPRPACGPDEVEMAITCPCSGFAYGEMGTLDLVRHRPGRLDERLELTPLYGEAGADGPDGIDTLAVLQRWPMRNSDYSAVDSDRLAPEIRARPATQVMVFGDYDHDGQATEFLLQVGTLPCGRRESVLVGVSAADPSLHVFRSLSHPERPLVLEARLWELLRRSGGNAARGASGVEWPCGDHGAETQTEVTLRAGRTGIDGTRAEYRCTAAGARGPLTRSERI